MWGKFILHSLCPLGDKGPDVFPPLVRSHVGKICILIWQQSHGLSLMRDGTRPGEGSLWLEQDGHWSPELVERLGEGGEKGGDCQAGGGDGVSLSA